MNTVVAKSTAILTLAVALIGHSVLAHADRRDGAAGSGPSITISYSELDVSRPRGVEVLYTRIKRAARSVCGIDRLHRELSGGRRAMACYQSTLDDAVMQVNRPTLTALHRASSKSALG